MRSGWTYIALVVVLGALFAVTGSPDSMVGTPDVASLPDVELYRAVAADLAEGRPYYESLNEHLRAMGFPVRPVFNWRTPLHLHLLAILGEGGSIALLFTVFVVGAVAWFPHFRAQGTVRMVVAGLLSVWSVVPLFTSVPLHFAEVWCGVALFLCMGLRARGRFGASAAAGGLALFLRALAAPWLVVLVLVDVRFRRWRVLAGWALVASLYALYYGYHGWSVQQYLMPDDGPVRSWWAIGGVEFVQSTFAFFPPLVFFPALYGLALAAVIMSSLAKARGPKPGLAVGALVWIGFLMGFGNSFNVYWGGVSAPLWAVLLADFPVGRASAGDE